MKREIRRMEERERERESSRVETNPASWETCETEDNSRSYSRASRFENNNPLPAMPVPGTIDTMQKGVCRVCIRTDVRTNIS
jgi:hypothetical protein